jgi:flavodoxin I
VTPSNDFIASKAVVGNQFIGLALDDDNQAHLTKERAKTWAAQVVKEMNLEPSLAAH